MFSELLAAGEQFPAVLTVPVYNAGMQTLLRDYGMHVEPRLTRMTRGRKRLHAREDLVYALSGPEKG